MLALALFQVFFLAEVEAGMFDFLKRYDVHLSPEVNGQVSLDGQPLTDVEVYRTLTYGEEFVDRTVTDSKGQFSFPELNIKSNRPGKLLDESRVRQAVGVVYEDKNYLLWYTVLGGTTPKRTVTEKLSSLDCDLSNPEKEYVFINHENPSFPHGVFSICGWDDNKLL